MWSVVSVVVTAAVLAVAGSLVIAGGLLTWLAWARDDLGLINCSRADGVNHRC